MDAIPHETSIEELEARFNEGFDRADRTAWSIANRCPKKCDQAALHNAALEGYWKAVKSYDPVKSTVDFWTYAVLKMSQASIDEARRNDAVGRSRRRQAEIDGVDANQIYESIDIGEEIAFECQRSVRDIELMLAKMDLANVLEVYNGRLTRKQSDFLRLYLSGLGVTDISKINGTTVAAPCRMLHYLAKQLRRRSRARPAVKQP